MIEKLLETYTEVAMMDGVVVTMVVIRCDSDWIQNFHFGGGVGAQGVKGERVWRR